jgi:PPP family 3-phenylpropionic acid transporter
MILMVMSIISVLSQPLWGMLSDRIHSIKKVFSFCIFASVMLILSLAVIKSIHVVMVMLPIIALMQSPLVPLLDIWILKSAQNGISASYGIIRMWGSIGFAVAVAIMGILVSKMSINIAFICYGTINSITFFICFGLKDIDRRSGDSDKAVGSDISYPPVKSYAPVRIFSRMSDI